MKRLYALLVHTLVIITMNFANEDTIYFIRDIQYQVDGRTKEFIVQEASEIQEGEEIHGDTALLEYIDAKKQILNNYRIFETVLLEHILVDQDEGNRIPVDIIIHAKDTRNFIIFPEPKYSSTDGFEPSLKLRDYNFLGRNTVLRTELGYIRAPDNEASYSKDAMNFELNVNVPFIALGFKWNFKFDNAIKYFFNESAVYKNTTGISIDIPVKRTTLTFGYDQGITANEEYYLYEKIKYNTNLKQFWFLTSAAYGSWKIPTGIKIKNLGELTYTPTLTGSINYSESGIELFDHTGQEITYSHTLGFDHIDWIDNFRKGYSISIDNSNKYNFYFNDWLNDIAVTAIGYWTPNRFLGISSRLTYKHWFDESFALEDKSRWRAASYLRGIDDNTITASGLFALNLDINFFIFTVKPSKILKIPVLSIFDFDFHLGPIFDIAIIKGIQVNDERSKVKDITISPDDWLISGGFEAKVFPLSFRSIFLRFSIGWNLIEAFRSGMLPSGDNREIYLGIGNYY